jgi:hypothetical protein
MAIETRHTVEKRAKFSIPSILAIVAAVLSFPAGAGWGLLLAIAAIALGVVGFVMALSPSVRGGIVSVLSMLAGGLGIFIALLKLIF